MPSRTFRHHEAVGSLGPGGFTATRHHRRIVTARTPASPGQAIAKAKAATATMDQLNEGLGRLATGLQTLADRRRAMRDAAAGRRARLMTPADLQAIHDKHYGRVR